MGKLEWFFSEDLVVQDRSGTRHMALSTIHFYRQAEEGRYREVHFMETSGEKIGFLTYNSKICHVTIRRTIGKLSGICVAI